MSKGIDESKVKELLESFEKGQKDKERAKTKKKEKIEKVLAKYFVHGLAFSLLFTVLIILWAFGFLVLIVLGAWIGWIIGLGLLMLITGGLNTLLTSFLWFPVKTSSWSIIGHGIVLFIVLLIVNGIAVWLPSMAFPGIATTIATFIFASFIDGFVCKQVAGFWEEEYEGIPEAVEAEWEDKNL
jgi:cation transport ATPase